MSLWSQLSIHPDPAVHEIGDPLMRWKTLSGLILLLYIVAGVIIAVQKHYITITLLKQIGTALLAVFLWWLLLLGVNLHIH